MTHEETIRDYACTEFEVNSTPQDVFCCGTEYHKYCCTKKDQVIQSQVQE